MAGKVLSMEIGSFLTKICEVDYKSKNSKIYHSFIVETPQGMLEDGVLTINESFISEINRNIQERKIRTKQMIFTIASTKIASREVLLPFVKENRISSLIRTNATSYFPVDVSKYQFAHNILKVETDDKGIQQYRVLILAAPNSLLEGYYQVAAALGMEVVAVDYIGNSIYQAVKSECSSGTQMIIKVDDFSTLLIIVKHATVALTRTIPYGISDGINSVIYSKAWGDKLSYLEAMEVVRNENVLIPSTTGSKTTTEATEFTETSVIIEKLDEAKKEVASSFATLVGGITRVMDYYNNSNSSEIIEKIILTGVGGDFLGLTSLLTHEIGFKVDVFSKLEGIDLEKTFKETNFGEYIGCIGATLAPLHFYSLESLDKKKSKNLNQMDYTTLSIAILILGVGVSAILVMLSFIPYISAKSESSRLAQRKEELAPIKDIYQAYLNSALAYEKLNAWDLTTYNAIDSILDFIEELENKMPTTFSTQNLVATSSGATLEVKVATKEEAAKVVEQLRTFESIASVTVASITEVESETGETQVVFSVEITFVTADGQITTDVENTAE